MKREYKVSLVFLAILMILTPISVNAKELGNNIEVNRIAGETRIETAIEISRIAYRDIKSDNVVIAGTQGEPDALTGTLLARSLDAPVLMVPKMDLPESVLAELDRLETSTVYILGKENVVDINVENQIKDNGIEVIRVGGENRAATAVEVLNHSNLQVVDEIFLAEGYKTLADALAAGPVSGKDSIPILLTQKNSIPQETLDEIDRINPDKITILGGEEAVSKSIETALPAGAIIDRVNGKDRGETALKIANRYFKTSDTVIVANGWKSADALVGGYLGAKKDMPILLSNGRDIDDSSVKYIRATKKKVNILGGVLSIGKSVIDKIKDLGQKAPSNKIATKVELRDFFLKKLKERPKDAIIINYYGKDLSTKKAVEKFLFELSGVGNYYTGNIDTYYCEKPIKNKNKSIRLEIEFTYRTTDKEEVFIKKEIDRITKKIIKPDMNEYNKVKAIHDYIVNKKIYTTNAKTDPYAAYSFLKQGKGVCNSFALTANRLLDKAGIENYYISGDVKGVDEDYWELHAWNKVKVDGEWYNIDTTFDHPEGEFGKHYAYYYFMVSDSRLKGTHKEKTPAYLPRAINKQYDGKYDEEDKLEAKVAS